MEKSTNKILTLAILSISMITVMASAAVSPALANISNAFPEAGINLIKTVLTLPSLFIIPFSLISGHLVHRFGNKKVLLIGIGIYIGGGVAPVFLNTIPQLLVARAVLGCGCGLIMPVSQALIAQNYTGTLKAKITGYSGAASYLMGVIASFAVAPLSAADWHYSFYIYLVAVLVFILNAVYLPEDKPLPAGRRVSNKAFPKRVWWVIAGILLVNIAFYAVPANAALFMKEQGIGSAKSAGTVISAFMIAGFFAGIVLSHLKKFIRRDIVYSGVALMGAGYILLSFAYNMGIMTIGSALVGFSFGILFPSLMILITNKSSGSGVIFALSVGSCAQFFGQFLSPYVLQGVKWIFGWNSLQYDFVILAFALSLVSLWYFINRQIKRMPVLRRHKTIRSSINEMN